MEISKLCVPFLPYIVERGLTLFQTNILVGSDGRARIAGLGTASILRAMPGVDVDRSFPGAAPELIDPQRWGSTDPGATKASDVYAFAVLAWEVRMESVTSINHSRMERSSPLDFRWATSVLQRERCHGDSFNAQWASTSTTGSPRTY